MNQKGICPICHNYDELIPILNANAPTKLRCPECLTHDEREAARHAKNPGSVNFIGDSSNC